MCLFDGCDRISRRAFVGAAFAAPLVARAHELSSSRDLVRRDYGYSRDSARIEGYVAYRTSRRHAPVVTVMHGNAGLPVDVRDTVDWLALLGFVAFAANPTTREPDPTTIPRSTLTGRGFGDRYIEDTRAGLAQMRKDGIGRNEGPIALLGYCGGGYCGLLWNDTPNRDELGVLVGIHVALHNFGGDGGISTSRPQGMDLYRRMIAPSQFHYGTADHLTPAKDMEELRSEGHRLGRILEIHSYEGADHGFAMSSDHAYRSDYAAQVRERAAAFLLRHFH